MGRGCQEALDVILMIVSNGQEEDGSSGQGEKFTGSGDVQEEQLNVRGD